MRKKLFTFLLAIVASIGILFASNTQVNGIWYDFNSSTLTASVTYRGSSYSSYSNEYSGAVVIPASVTYLGRTYSVTSIGYAAFENCTNLTSISIPYSISNIKGMAFYNCSSLTSVHISDIAAWCAISFGDNPLYYAHNLYLNGELVTDLVIPNSVTSIGEYAFEGCSGLTSVTIPNSVTSIGNSAFNGCSGLTSVTIPNSVTSIGDNAFTNCSGLTSVTIPNSVTTIGKRAFYGCIVLASIEIPNNVTSIGDEAFCHCNSLTSINVASDNLNYCSVDGVLFNKTQTVLIQYPASKIAESYTIANSVTTIGNYAFYNCSSLTAVTIPNSVTSIGEHAFEYCSGLTSVTIPNSVTSIGESAFRACFGLTSVTIGNSVTSIGDEAFSFCAEMTSITIPNSVTSIGERIFYYCPKLASIQWNAKHYQDFTSTSTPFYYHSSSATYNNFDIRSQITSFTFGDEVEYIPAYLCAGMNNANIVIENCKTVIGAHALDNCNYTIQGTYNIILPDTTLCYGEELIIDGVQCDIQKTPNIRQTWTRNLQTTEGCDSIISISVLWKRVATLSSFNFTVKDAFDTPNSGSISWTVDGNTDYKYDYYTINGQKNASTYSLTSGAYRLVFYNEACTDSIVKNITIDQYGLRINGMYYLLDDLYHTATLTYRGTSYGDYSGEYSGNITIPKTITFEGKDYQVTGIKSYAFEGCNNIKSITMESETPISMYSSGLSNNCIIYVPYGSLNAYKSASGWRNYAIHVINPSHTTTTTGATSATITLGNTNEAQHIASCGMDGGEEEFAGNVIEYIGLEPNSEYANVPLFIKTKEGDLDNTTVSFTTTTLELTTKPSKPVSGTTAILLAETNMSDAEVSCGFEYKRNDAPEDMAGTKVFCPVASGQMAGRLKNLKDDVYYKYRAFYQSAAGNMYYGDWQYIFTGDVAVEFDPILYTYGATVVRENEATISGYALAGSEDFTEQGFEYWAESRANGGANAPRRMPAALNEHFFVQASGISLRVTLTNLDAGTVYKYRVYGKVGDQYYYGSEQTFTTTGTYTPPTYTITFANWDGTELQSSQVEEGTLPEYTGATPERPEDERYTYSFNGWTPTIVIASADATYTATYTETPKGQGIDGVQSNHVQCTKVIRNDQIYILRGDKTYTLQGQEVK